MIVRGAKRAARPAAARLAPQARKTLPIAPRGSGTPRGRPSWPAPSKWRESTCASVLDARRAGHGEVDRLAARARRGAAARARRARRGRRSTTPRWAKRSSTGPGRRPPRAPVALHEPVALERARRAATAVLFGSSGHGARARRRRAAGRFDDEHEQLGGAVDRLGAGLGESLVMLTRGTPVPHLDLVQTRPAPSTAHPPTGRHACSSTSCRATRSSREDAVADARPRVAADRHRARRRVHHARGASSCSPRPGMKTEGDNVWLDPDFVLEQVAKAPRQFDVQARNPANNVHHRRRPHGVRVGLRAAVRARGRRAPRRDDGRLPQLRKLAQSFPQLDSAGGTIVEPNDAPLDSRHLDMVLRAADADGQAYMGSVTSRAERGRHDRA